MQGVASRDIKLENTLLDGSPRPLLKICDFGYSKVSLPWWRGCWDIVSSGFDMAGSLLLLCGTLQSMIAQSRQSRHCSYCVQALQAVMSSHADISGFTAA